MNPVSLSILQRYVLDRLMVGGSTASIAGELGLSRSTVKERRRELYRKLRVRSLRELFAARQESRGQSVRLGLGLLVACRELLTVVHPVEVWTRLPRAAYCCVRADRIEIKLADVIGPPRDLSLPFRVVVPVAASGKGHELIATRLRPAFDDVDLRLLKLLARLAVARLISVQVPESEEPAPSAACLPARAS